MSAYSDDDFSSSRFSSDLPTGKTENVDRELENFLMIEKHKVQLNAQIHMFNEFCWEKCMPERLGTKVDSKTETCLSNCVDRFIDAYLLIANRFASVLDKSSKSMNYV